MEIWKDIKGYEGLYQVSNLSRVRSVDRVIVNKNGIKSYHEGKVLSTFKNGEYRGVHLWKDNKEKKKLVHHIVAEAFIPNPENKPFVDHIIPLSNGGKDELENLRWCTYKENSNNTYTLKNISNSSKGRPSSFKGKHHSDEAKKKMSHAKIGTISPKRRIVECFDLNGNLVCEYESAYATEKYGFSQGHVSSCCRGEEKTHKGFIWKYKK